VQLVPHSNFVSASRDVVFTGHHKSDNFSPVLTIRVPINEENNMPGSFELYKDKAGEYRFRLKASNGEIILASEGYKAKTSCKNGIASVMKNATSESRFEKTEAKNGKARFNLRAGNNQIIGTSELYNSTAARDNGIKSVMKHAPKAAIKDMTA
jgi:uncharacterized protein YegP (UPF0339 family)